MCVTQSHTHIQRKGESCLNSSNWFARPAYLGIIWELNFSFFFMSGKRLRNAKLGQMHLEWSVTIITKEICEDLWDSPVAQSVKNLPAMQETLVRSLCRDDPLEKEMTTHSSILSWRIPGQKSLAGYSLWVAKSWTQVKQLSVQAHTQNENPMCCT